MGKVYKSEGVGGMEEACWYHWLVWIQRYEQIICSLLLLICCLVITSAMFHKIHCDLQSEKCVISFIIIFFLFDAHLCTQITWHQSITKMEYKWSYTWTAENDMKAYWSSQLYTQLKQLWNKACWPLCALASLRSWVQIPFRSDLFSGFNFTTA